MTRSVISRLVGSNDLMTMAGTMATIGIWLGTRSHRQRPAAVLAGEGISFHDTDGDGECEELETNNGDSSPGDWGGPFFAWWPDGWPYIVGEVSGQEQYQFPFSTEDTTSLRQDLPWLT